MPRSTAGIARGAYFDGAGDDVWLGACHLCSWRYGPTTSVSRARAACDDHDRDVHGRYKAVSNRKNTRASRASA